MQNMAYKVIIMSPAKRRLDMYIGYTAIQLKNRQAAKNIRDDAKTTKAQLSDMADVLKLCDNPVLAEHGYRKIHFGKHDFIMIYRIDGNKAIVDGMYHELQDYEATFIDEMHLM